MTTSPQKSDLPVRAASAVVMIAVAGSALWLGGWVWTAFVALVALGVLWEWMKLSLACGSVVVARMLWIAGGAIYIGGAASVLVLLRNSVFGVAPLLVLIGAVIATDIGAYFAGRAIGGPKIAPSISPSKTWAGLFGAIASVGVFLVVAVLVWQKALQSASEDDTYYLAVHGAGWIVIPPLVATVAQSGDFFESWMKRRAGVKDSGSLIPGHGGLFDRIDGLLAVSFAVGVMLSIVGAFPTQSSHVELIDPGAGPRQ